MVIASSNGDLKQQKPEVIRVPVTPDVLLWARKKAGLSLEDVVEKAKISALKSTKEVPGKTAAQRLDEWEKGQSTPTLNQLEAIAKVYRRPLVTFFLSYPPQESNLLKDFRTVGDREPGSLSPNFAALKRRIENLYWTLKDISQQQDIHKKEFIGSVSLKTPVQNVVQNIREHLEFSFEDQRHCADSQSLLRLLREKLDIIGVYVVFLGDLGIADYHSSVEASEFRGIAIADPLTPMIIINPYDAKVAQVFTLIHELAHLWLGESGISNLGLKDTDYDGSTYPELESFCNAVAAEFLVPDQEIFKCYYAKSLTANVTLDEIENVSRYFKVSEVVIVRKLLDLHKISTEKFWGLFNIYEKRFREYKEKQKQKQKEKSGFPPRKILVRSYLGEKLIYTLLNASRDGFITSQDASRLLKVPVSGFKELVP